MSNAISALDGKVAAGAVSIREMGLQGMITLRGDLSAKPLRAICEAVTGQTFPAGKMAQVEGGKGLCWMSPDEVLVLVPYEAATKTVSEIEAALKGTYFLAANVSDARALIRVEGPYAREVIAKLAPIDLHPSAFGPRDFRRSRLGQVAAAFWMQDEDTIDVICFRSVAEYTFNLLATSAKAGAVGVL